MQLVKNGLKALLVFSILVFTASEVAAKKPDGNPGGKPPSCTGLVAPDYAFWRDARTKGKNRMAQVAVYVAESDTGCEAKLLDIPLPEGPINYLKLAFSSSVDNGGKFILGRIVWLKKIVDGAYSVSMYDFTIEEGSVVRISGPKMLMENTGAEHLRINGLDLSPDMQSLAYQLYESGDPDISSIRTIDIETCLEGCAFDDGLSLYQLINDPDTIESLRSPVWGPLGNRIYFAEREDDFFYLKAISSSGLSLKTLFTFLGDAEQGGIRDIASGMGYGWPVETEYIAVAIGNFFAHGCARIYSLDVTSCDAGDGCVLTYETAGTLPSWTKDGKLIHVSHGLTIRNLDNCRVDSIGLWDGTNLRTITKGWEPAAAGGG